MLLEKGKRTITNLTASIDVFSFQKLPHRRRKKLWGPRPRPTVALPARTLNYCLSSSEAKPAAPPPRQSLGTESSPAAAASAPYSLPSKQRNCSTPTELAAVEACRHPLTSYYLSRQRRAPGSAARSWFRLRFQILQAEFHASPASFGHKLLPLVLVQNQKH